MSGVTILGFLEHCMGCSFAVAGQPVSWDAEDLYVPVFCQGQGTYEL